MEELQDAIEDAQYVNAISSQDYGPRPVLAWEVATDEQLAQWKQSKLRQQQQQLRTTSGSAATAKNKNNTNNANANVVIPFTLDWTCSSAIGMFMFSSFLKDDCNDYLRINFCEQVIRWKRLRGRHRIEKAKDIIVTYLKPPTRVVVVVDDDNNDNDDEDGKETGGGKTTTRYKNLPIKMEIDEFDLARSILPPSRRLTQHDIEVLCDTNMDKSGISKDSCVGLIGGPILDEIYRVMEEAESQQRISKGDGRSSTPTKGSPSDVTTAAVGAGVSGPSTTTATTATTTATDTTAAAATTTTTATTTTNAATVPTTTTEEGTAVISAENHLDQQQQSSSSSGRATAESDGVCPDDDTGATKQEEPATATTPPPTTTTATGTMYDQSDDRYDSLQKQLSKMNIDRRQSRARKYLPDNLFDRAEAVVMESLRRQYWDAFCESAKYRKMENFLWYGDKRVVPEDFFILRVLGRGGFGLVTACKKGTSGKLYAMKVMNKRRIKMKKSEQLALNERAALAAVESPFVVNLKYSFHSKDDVFLILDLMTGGDLGYHLHQKGRFPKKECLYYAARIMLGLQALHDHRFVYRDLKPENCLLADDGRVRITDLGLATKITPTLHGAAGTRGYWAPEMLRRDSKGKRMPYGHTVDWFSFGCCLAEFISGQNPFRSEAALNFGLAKGKQGKEKAIDCATLEMDPEFDPKYFDTDAADLCQRLLEKDETKRLGTNGCEEIMVHPWFRDVNWEMILSDRKKPPFVPPKDVNAASQSEIGNFAEDKTYQDTVIEEKDEDVYKDWDWTNPHAFAAEVIEFLIYERETGEPLIPLSQQSTCCCTIL